MTADPSLDRPVFFPGGENTIFGVFTEPASASRDAAVVVLPGGGRPLATNRNRMSVRLCRGVSEDGFHGMRFDYHGCGESTGSVGSFRLDRPFTEDLEGAMRWIEGQGVHRFVLVGSCFGARTVLSTAAGTPGLEGVVLISPPVRDFVRGERSATRLAREWTAWDYVRRAFRPRVLRSVLDAERRRAYARLVGAKWRAWRGRRRGSEQEWRNRYEVSENFLRPLESLVERRVPVLVVFGVEEDLYRDFDRARAGRLGRILERGGSGVELVTLPGTVHGFTSIAVQEAVLDRVRSWISALPVAAGRRDGVVAERP